MVEGLELRPELGDDLGHGPGQLVGHGGSRHRRQPVVEIEESEVAVDESEPDRCLGPQRLEQRQQVGRRAAPESNIALEPRRAFDGRVWPVDGAGVGHDAPLGWPKSWRRVGTARTSPGSSGQLSVPQGSSPAIGRKRPRLEPRCTRPRRGACQQPPNPSPRRSHRSRGPARGGLGGREPRGSSERTGHPAGALGQAQGRTDRRRNRPRGAERRARRRVVSQREGRKTCCRGSGTYYARSRAAVTAGRRG